MRRADRWLAWLLVATALGFGFGLTRLFSLRFESGDVYPAYSTLRPDPVGARALYDSLAALDGVRVQRFYQPIDKLDAGRPTTLLYLGMMPSPAGLAGPQREFELIENIARQGGRVVVSFTPVTRPDRWAAPESGERDEPRAKEDTAIYESSRPVTMTERWGFSFGWGLLQSDPRQPVAPVEVVRDEAYAGDARLPDRMRWRTSAWFDKLDADWRVVYWRDKWPVVVERTWGQGEIVLVGDSFPLSNEALRTDRQAGFLAWVIGENADIVFDETHLGMNEPTGIMILARKYRLHGLMAGVLLLGLLYVWKNASPFIPPAEEPDTRAFKTDIATGRDAAAALVSLLRRTIAPGEIIAVCVAEWRKGVPSRAGRLTAKLERIQRRVIEEQTLPARQRNPVGAYRDIARIMNERK